MKKNLTFLPMLCQYAYLLELELHKVKLSGSSQESLKSGLLSDLHNLQLHWMYTQGQTGVALALGSLAACPEGKVRFCL